MKSLTTQPEPQQDTLATFENELIRIANDRARLLRQREESQHELATFADRARIRSEQEQAAQETITSARNALAEAQVRHELLTSPELTKASEANLSTLKKRLSVAQDHQMKLLSRHQQEADADKRKETALQETINRAHITLAHLAEREQITHRLKEQATREQGETTLRTCLDTLRAMEAQRDIQRSTLHRMEEEIAEYIHQASTELARFPAQQEAFIKQFEFNDTLTGIFQAQIDLIDLVLTTGRDTPEIPLEVTRRANILWQGVAELLAFNAADFRPALSRESMAHPEILIERKELLSKLLKLYREVQG